MVSCNRLWVGTGNGVIISIPLTESKYVFSWLSQCRWASGGNAPVWGSGGRGCRSIGSSGSSEHEAGGKGLTTVPHSSCETCEL